ncbi:uncharacterized protein LOC117224253 [Megalopta genalis]|uniref:uncharacterized protein LOC117224253 n=1 Tax=Megalopta genalis TaxID=115081 RepID=UPI003FD5AEC3
MLKLFSRGVWLAILATYVLISVFAYIFRAIETGMRRQCMAVNMIDYFFYNFSAICNQSCDSGATSESSKILEYSSVVFAFLINVSFNALVIGYMTQTVTVMPFDDVTSLIYNSQYDIITVNGSMAHMSYERDYLPSHSYKKPTKRVIVVDHPAELFRNLCSQELMATLLIEEEKQANRHYMCDLEPLILPRSMDIVSGISLNFENKRSIDFGLLKLHETGLIHAMHNYWLKTKRRQQSGPEPVLLEQVYLVIYLLFVGIFVSVTILIFELITFHSTN